MEWEGRLDQLGVFLNGNTWSTGTHAAPTVQMATHVRLLL